MFDIDIEEQKLTMLDSVVSKMVDAQNERIATAIKLELINIYGDKPYLGKPLMQASEDELVDLLKANNLSVEIKNSGFNLNKTDFFRDITNDDGYVFKYTLNPVVVNITEQ